MAAASNSPSMLAMILGSGLLSAALTQLASTFLAKRNSKKSANFLGLRLALIIEAYGEDCLDLAQEHDIHIGSHGQAGGRTHHLPKMGDLPEDDLAWRELPSDLTARILGLEPLIRATQRQIAFTWSEGDPEDAMSECRNEAVSLGCKAADLAHDLRARLKLPSMQSKWDWVGDLREMQRQLEAQRHPAVP